MRTHLCEWKRTYGDVEVGLLRELRVEGSGQEAVVPPGVDLKKEKWEDTVCMCMCVCVCVSV